YVAKLPAAQIIASAVVLAGISVLAVGSARSRPWIIVGWLWFLGTLVPVIGLIQVGDQAWADRYTYLPLIGIFIAVVWTVADMVQAATFKFQGTGWSGKLFGVSALGLGVALMVVSSVQL